MVALLSLAVAADAGDMLTTMPRPKHGIGLFQINVKHKDTGNPSAHHPEETSPEPKWKRSEDPASDPPGGLDVAGDSLRESGHCAREDAQNRLFIRDALTRCRQDRMQVDAMIGNDKDSSQLFSLSAVPMAASEAVKQDKDDWQRHVRAANPTPQCK